MKLGIIARADQTGLGYQTKSYVKHLNPSKVILIDSTSFGDWVRPQFPEWYANHNMITINGIPRDDELKTILSGLDVLLTAETPYNLNLYKVAREMGVKTVCVENAEFYDHIKYPEFEMPDLIIMPSVWKYEEIKAHAESRGTKVVQLHHPVDRDEITYIPRTKATFMHIAGKPAAFDRNGTWDFLQACPNGVITTQSDDLRKQIGMRYPQSQIYFNIQQYNHLYQMADIMVLPRRYGGNCLVLNEALAAGMPVIMPDISPNNHLLPSEWLVPAHETGVFEPRTTVPIYSVDIRALYSKLEWFREQDIATHSAKANELADSISWKTLKPEYERVLKEI